MKKYISLLSISLLAIIAIPVLAATPSNFSELVDSVFISGILQPIVPFLIGLGVVVFIYGVLILMFSEGGEKKEDGKKYMLWGIIGIFVMVSVWGLVNILKDTFNLNQDVPAVEIKLNN
jgi:putative cell wall-binding protein